MTFVQKQIWDFYEALSTTGMVTICLVSKFLEPLVLHESDSTEVWLVPANEYWG